ncbi:SDR family NAD(P)-dependent oxidoreductase [Kitasatospora sp. NPDC058218]|uniref:SDR family NAD(P)-dependent oxidoreductase n=1 Tax=Kitasatospora sp. NPDC058218 TaxID=3346385 RepID=UPI0036DE58EB
MDARGSDQPDDRRTPRSVLVTGATSGIGLATALLLAGRGWQVVGTARSRAKADELLRVAAAQGVRVEAVVMDLADAASCEAAVAEAAERTGGGPHALVGNAGIPLSGAVCDLPDERVREVLEVNVLGTMRMCRLVLPAMRTRGRGRIVTVSSAAARIPAPMSGWYTASKHALSAATHSLRMEVERHGAQVALVEPGAFATPFWDRARADLAHPDLGADPAGYARSAALFSRVQRLRGGPEPVARTIARAVEAARPRRRYTVGVDARLGIAAQALTPLWLSDRIKRGLYGPGPAPTALPALKEGR